MKLLFVHDHVFSSSEEGVVYSAAAYPSKSWERYLTHFNEVIVVGRYAGMVVDTNNKLVVSSHDNVYFSFVPSISNPINLVCNRSIVKTKIRDLVRCSDVVVARLPSENGLIAIRYARELNKPFAVEVVGCVWDALWNHGSLLAKLYAPIAFFRTRYAVRLSNKTLYVTENFLQNRYPSSNGALNVSASNVEVNVPEMVGIERRAWEEDRIVIGIIGNFKTKYKGIHLAIEALASLKNILGDFELRILGNGNPDDYMDLASELGIKEQVVFCGTLPNGEAVMQWLDEVDLYLQPSLTEGMPRSLIEAMSRGCICIGSDAGGIPELLPSRYLHKSGDVSDLSNVIENMLCYKSSWPEISIQNHEAAKKYDAQVLSHRRFLFYKSLADELERL